MKQDKSDAHAQAIAFTGLVGIFSLIILLARGRFQSYITRQELPFFVAITLFTTAATVFTFKGIKLIEASEHTILLTSSRLWLLAGAVLFLHERLTGKKLIGTVIILLGVIITQWKRRKFVVNQGAFYVLVAAMLFAISEVISYFILKDFDVFSFMVYACAFSLTALIAVNPQAIRKLSFYFYPKHAFNIVIVSFNDALANLCGFIAYQIGRNALQIGPLMSTQTIVTVLLAILILRERGNMRQKLSGAVLAVAGTILLL